MNPTLSLFLRLTLIVTVGIVALVVAAFLLKIALVAAVIAALAVGGFLLYNAIRRSRLPVIR